MSNIELECDNCGKRFWRRKGEVNRNAKLGRRTFCSLRCVGKQSYKHLESCVNRYDISLHANNHRDKYSPFRYNLKCMKNLNRKHECTVTLTDLKEQWEKQDGVCPITGWKLQLPGSSNEAQQLSFTPDRVSVDRIDSSKSYEKGNIQFVSMIAQFAKSRWTIVEVVDFARSVVDYHGMSDDLESQTAIA